MKLFRHRKLNQWMESRGLILSLTTLSQEVALFHTEAQLLCWEILPLKVSIRKYIILEKVPQNFLPVLQLGILLILLSLQLWEEEEVLLILTNQLRLGFTKH
ncbi:hypothetical protein D3C86_1881340 [compost metagenome]